MAFDARALRMGVYVALRGGSHDIPATQALVRYRRIELDRVLHCLSFRPILELELGADGPLRDLVLVTAFEYLKDGLSIEWLPYPQRAEHHMRVFPHMLPNLDAYRGPQMLGAWEVRAHVALIRESMLDVELPDDPEAADPLIALLRGLRYHRLASFDWQIVPATPVARLTHEGELVDPDRLLGTRGRINLSIDDI